MSLVRLVKKSPKNKKNKNLVNLHRFLRTFVKKGGEVANASRSRECKRRLKSPTQVANARGEVASASRSRECKRRSRQRKPKSRMQEAKSPSVRAREKGREHHGKEPQAAQKERHEGPPRSVPYHNVDISIQQSPRARQLYLQSVNNFSSPRCRFPCAGVVCPDAPLFP